MKKFILMIMIIIGSIIIVGCTNANTNSSNPENDVNTIISECYTKEGYNPDAIPTTWTDLLLPNNTKTEFSNITINVIYRASGVLLEQQMSFYDVSIGDLQVCRMDGTSGIKDVNDGIIKIQLVHYEVAR